MQPLSQGSARRIDALRHHVEPNHGARKHLACHLTMLIHNCDTIILNLYLYRIVRMNP